ncbi:flagellar biosynthesis protein FlgA [Chelatococcus sp. GCM10030263]|uniref:flagellar biosynthesis protein FlgA n=1 Tax=Chelatococcus sp. GCM10030263 TaxID=3273387 RepID=UPI003610B056
MNLEAIFGRSADMPVRAGLVGAGEFGATFVAQSRRIPGLTAPVICDRDPERARRALCAAGLAVEDIAICDDKAAALRALELDKTVVIADAALLPDLPLDVIVEATGDPEGAAATVLAAIESGRHSVLATKETESVVGPILARRAAAAGLIHTPVDGDQPSLLIGLVGWARLLGLEIIAAGKASESDFVWDPATGLVTAWGRSCPAPSYHAAFGSVDAAAARDLAEFPRTTVPDLCEMTIVANHTGLVPDLPELHAPIARTIELPHLFRPREEGGLLGRRGAVDMFNCLRRPDELSFAGGVFVTLEAPDPATGQLFAQKGIPASPDGRCFLAHNPVHLLGAEAAMSVLSAARLRCSTGGTVVRPAFDLVARARRDLVPGERLDLGARHAIAALDHLMLPARPLGPDAAVPYYLLAGRTVRAPARAGEIITAAHVALDPISTLYRLRAEQDQAFFS